MTQQTTAILIIGAVRLSFAIAPFVPIAQKDLDDTALSKEVMEEADEVLSARAARVLLVGFLLSSGLLLLSQVVVVCSSRFSLIHIAAWSLTLVLVCAIYFCTPTRLLRHPLTAIAIAVITSVLDLGIGAYSDGIVASTCKPL